MNEMKTPDEWVNELGILVLDPDGWRNDGKSWDEPIDQDEFHDLAGRSTCAGIGAWLR